MVISSGLYIHIKNQHPTSDTTASTDTVINDQNTNRDHNQIIGFALGSSISTLSDAELKSTLDGIKKIGATSIRFDVAWNALQPNGPNQYNWKGYDKVVYEASQRELSSLIILDYTPAWARQEKCKDTLMCPPAKKSDFAKYASAVVSRYQPKGVKVYEIWNEQNINQYWKPMPNAAEYVELLRDSYIEIKKVSKDTTVLFGGMSPAGDPKEAIAPRDFLKLAYANGAKGYFDALAYHPYTSPFLISQDNLATNWKLIDTSPANLKSIMKDNGDIGKQIWLTEYGAPTNGAGKGASGIVLTPNYGHVSEDMQATMVKQSLNDISQKSWIKSLYWYTYKDGKSKTLDRENYFGVLRADGTPKPAFNELQYLLKK